VLPTGAANDLALARLKRTVSAQKPGKVATHFFIYGPFRSKTDALIFHARCIVALLTTCLKA
jgi:hypothetical protein